MRRALLATYGCLAYLAFAVATVWGVLAIGDLGIVRGIDAAPRTSPLLAVAIDAAILALFAVQHTIMARPWFKARWTTLVPPEAERSTFVLVASLILILLFAAWQPIAGDAWSVALPFAYAVQAIAFAGWALVIASTFAFSHTELFGLKQTLGARDDLTPELHTPLLYLVVRHPMMLGFVLVFWAAPHMTFGHLLLAVLATGYIVVGIAFEERDLIRTFGDAYRTYRSRVPGLIPFPRPKHRG